MDKVSCNLGTGILSLTLFGRRRWYD